MSVDEIDEAVLRMNSQPKSEQKFRSQTNDPLNRNKNLDPNTMTIGAATIGKNGVKKNAVKQFLE